MSPNDLLMEGVDQKNIGKIAEAIFAGADCYAYALEDAAARNLTGIAIYLAGCINARNSAADFKKLMSEAFGWSNSKIMWNLFLQLGAEPTSKNLNDALLNTIQFSSEMQDLNWILEYCSGRPDAMSGAVHAAASASNCQVLQAVLSAGGGVGINETDEAGDAPLHRAAARGKRDIVSCLLRARADYEQETKKGWRPLHFAAASESIETVRLLLKAGADRHARTIGENGSEGKTALQIALHVAKTIPSSNHLKIVELLREKTDARAFARSGR